MVVTMVEIHIANKMLARDLKMTVQHRTSENCLTATQLILFLHINKILKSFLEINGGSVFFSLIPTKIFTDVKQKTLKNGS